MTTTDLTYESAWTTAAKGSERHARIMAPPEGPFGGESVAVIVLCKGGGFSQQERDHAQHRAEGLARYLDLSVGRMMRHSGSKSVRNFVAEHRKPAVTLIGGDKTNWSLSVQHRTQGISVFCDWKGEEIVRVWTAR